MLKQSWCRSRPTRHECSFELAIKRQEILILQIAFATNDTCQQIVGFGPQNNFHFAGGGLWPRHAVCFTIPENPGIICPRAEVLDEIRRS